LERSQADRKSYNYLAWWLLASVCLWIVFIIAMEGWRTDDEHLWILIPDNLRGDLNESEWDWSPSCDVIYHIGIVDLTVAIFANLTLEGRVRDDVNNGDLMLNKPRIIGTGDLFLCFACFLAWSSLLHVYQFLFH
jgi:hypothetical protein